MTDDGASPTPPPPTSDIREDDHFNDHWNRKIFGHAELVAQLVRTFVNKALAADIDFTTLRRANTVMMTPEARRRETDMLWEVQTVSGPVLLWLLIEFQSTSERFMALRVLEYIVYVYTHLADKPSHGQAAKRRALESRPPSEPRRQLGRGFLLPPILPIVLYSGERTWTAPTDLQDLIDPTDGFLQAFVPRFTYFLIAKKALSREILCTPDNLVAAIFRFETSAVDEVPETGGALHAILTTVDPGLRSDLESWMNAVFRRKNLIPIDFTTLDNAEVIAMLETNIDRFRLKAVAEGKLEGKIEGKLEGKLEGQRDMLILQVRERFQDADDTTLAQLSALSDPQALHALILAFVRCPDWQSFQAALNEAAPKTS